MNLPQRRGMTQMAWQIPTPALENTSTHLVFVPLVLISRSTWRGRKLCAYEYFPRTTSRLAAGFTCCPMRTRANPQGVAGKGDINFCLATLPDTTQTPRVRPIASKLHYSPTPSPGREARTESHWTLSPPPPCSVSLLCVTLDVAIITSKSQPLFSQKRTACSGVSKVIFMFDMGSAVLVHPIRGLDQRS